MMSDTTQVVSELEEVVSVDEESGEEMVSPEDQAMVLVEVVSAALASALDAGLPAEVVELRFKLKDEGGVAVYAIDEAGVEVEKIISIDEIVEVLGY
jgi:hypothetical protein